MSEYVSCWRVQVAYALTDIQRYNLVASLVGINGAKERESLWWRVKRRSSVDMMMPMHDLLLRIGELHLSLLHQPGEYPPPPRMVLLDAILSYEGEKPEKESLPEEFAGDGHFSMPLEPFTDLYFDILLLKRADVRAYCRENQIRQVCEVKGLLWEDPPGALPQAPAEAAPPVPVDTPIPAQETPPVSSPTLQDIGEGIGHFAAGAAYVSAELSKGIKKAFSRYHAVTTSETETAIDVSPATPAPPSPTAPAPLLAEAEFVNEKPVPARGGKRRKYRRGAISASKAAEILGVSLRQIQNWDAGINRPDGYPGRMDAVALELFVNQWAKTQLMKERARAMNRAVSGGGVADQADRDAFDEM